MLYEINHFEPVITFKKEILEILNYYFFTVF